MKKQFTILILMLTMAVQAQSKQIRLLLPAHPLQSQSKLRKSMIIRRFRTSRKRKTGTTSMTKKARRFAVSLAAV